MALMAPRQKCYRNCVWANLIGEGMAQLEAANLLGRVQMSEKLRGSVQRAISYAYEQSHRQVTLEHLLLALTEDREAAVILEASGIDVQAVVTDVAGHLGRMENRVQDGEPREPALGADVQHIIQSAGAAAQKSNRRSVGSALVLAAIVGDGRSSAAKLLQLHGLTFEQALTALKKTAASAQASQSGTPAQVQPQTQPQPAPMPRLGPTAVANPAAAVSDGANDRQPATPAPPTNGTVAAPANRAGERLQNVQAAHDIIASARERIAAARGAISNRPHETPGHSQPSPGAAISKPAPSDDVTSNTQPPPSAPSHPATNESAPGPSPAARPSAAQMQPTPAEVAPPRSPQPSPVTAPPQYQHERARSDVPASTPTASSPAPVARPVSDPYQAASEAPARAPDAPVQPRSNPPRAGQTPAHPHAAAPTPAHAAPPFVPSPAPAPMPAPPQQPASPMAGPAPGAPPMPGRPHHEPQSAPGSQQASANGAPLRPGNHAPRQQPVAGTAPPSRQHTETSAPPQWPQYADNARPAEAGVANPSRGDTGPPTRPPANNPATAAAAKPRPIVAPPANGPQGISQPQPGPMPPPQQGFVPPNHMAGFAPLDPAQLTEEIPKRMRVGVPVTVEVRAPRGPLEAWSGSADPRVHQQIITKAMAMRLKAPKGGFSIEIASPETQWSEGHLGPLSDDIVSWRWQVTPQKRGRLPLQLSATTRVVGRDGLAAARALPDQTVTVRVTANVARSAARLAVWLCIAALGVAIGYYAENILTIGSSMLAQVRMQ